MAPPHPVCVVSIALLVAACLQCTVHAGPSQASSAAPARSVKWYLSANNIAANVAFAKAHRGALTGAFLCCSIVRVEANGSVALRYTLPQSRSQLQPLNELGLDTWVTVAVSEAAVLNGTAALGIPALVAHAAALGVPGLMVDYEPPSKYTLRHAQLYATFLRGLAAAMHSKGLQVAMCTSDWGILDMWPQLSKAQVDKYMLMGPTYEGRNITYIHDFVTAMLKYLPPANVSIGIGSAILEPFKDCDGHNVWTQPELHEFVGWVADQGINEIDVWRCDIDDYMTTKPLYFTELEYFLSLPRGGT